MKCLSRSEERLDVMASHDWPLGIYQHGNAKELLRKKPFFRQEVEQNALGSPANQEILFAIKPKRWFAAHLHVKFEATVVHGKKEAQKSLSNEKETTVGLVPSQVTPQKDVVAQDKPEATQKIDEENKPSNGNETEGLEPSQVTQQDVAQDKPAATQKIDKESAATKEETAFHGLESDNNCNGPDLTELMTKFLALDKCLPRRQYLSVIHIPAQSKEEARFEYDPEWLAIVRKTHHLTCKEKRPVSVESEPMEVSMEETNWVRERIVEHNNGSLCIPNNFCRTVPIYSHPMFQGRCRPFPAMGNPQTDTLLSILDLDHSITVACDPLSIVLDGDIEDENEIEIDDISDDGNGGRDVPQDENEIEIDDMSDENGTENPPLDGAKDTTSDEKEIKIDNEPSISNTKDVVEDGNGVDLASAEEGDDCSGQSSSGPKVKKVRYGE